MYTYVLAMALIVGSDTSIFPEEHPILIDYIKEIAVDWQLLDPNELKLFFNDLKNFTCDVNQIQSRYEKFLGVPFAIDGKRFPGREFAIEAKKFNFDYQKQINFNILMSNDKEYWRQVSEENKRLYHIWDLVVDVNTGYYYVTVRREALKNLRDAIGEDAYYRGELPPYVPLWRFYDLSAK